MKTFVVRRLFFMILSVIAATLIVFSMSRLQGDPRNLFLASGYTTQEQWDAWGKELGLDKPLPIQYFVWLGKAMTGDFGKSLKSGYDSTTMLRLFGPASIQLGLAAWVFVLITGLPLGVLSAVKRGTVWDLVGRTFAVFGQALPPFWLGIMLILIFSVQLDWLPPGTRGEDSEPFLTRLSYIILPAATLGWLASAGLMRLVRSSMLEVLDSEFVKLARAKGVGNTTLIWKHALKNALIPPLTFAALIMASFIAGTVVTETVFAWPGLGYMTVQAIINNDFPVMTTAVMMFTILYVMVVFLVDILYAFVDPRIRYS